MQKEVVTQNDMKGFSAIGRWITLIIGSVTAVIEKSTTNSTVTITAEAIGKVGKWVVGTASQVVGESFSAPFMIFCVG